MPIRKRIFVLFIAAMLMCISSITVCAQNAPDMSKKGSIKVTIQQGTEVISGGTLTLYRVGAIQESDGNYSFVLTGDFKDCGESLDDIQSAQLAKNLAQYAADHSLSGTVKEIGRNGTVVFSDLEPGLYLLVQETAPEGYEKIDPFLVTVPMEEDGSYVYDVDASPKVEPNKPEEPTKPSEPANPTEPVEPTEPTDPSEPANPTEPTEPMEPTDPSEPTKPLTPTDPSGPSTPSKPSTPALPQTGQLTWPIPVLVVLGLGLFSLGWMLRFGRRKGSYEE